MTATVYAFPATGAGARRDPTRTTAPAPAPKVRPPRECLVCGTLSRERWCSDRCFRMEDGGPYEPDDGDDAA